MPKAFVRASVMQGQGAGDVEQKKTAAAMGHDGFAT